MAVKIRLSRHGKKNHAFFHIVVADIRAPRDGRYIEQLGVYNPNTNPATIKIDHERALYWLGTGAQPTDTCRRILSYEGILLRKHLNGGVAKGAISQETADQRWNENLKKTDNETRRELLNAEAKVNQERAEAISKRKAEEAAAKAEAEAKAKAEAEAAEAAANAETAEAAPAAE